MTKKTINELLLLIPYFRNREEAKTMMDLRKDKCLLCFGMAAGHGEIKNAVDVFKYKVRVRDLSDTELDQEIERLSEINLEENEIKKNLIKVFGGI